MENTYKHEITINRHFFDDVYDSAPAPGHVGGIWYECTVSALDVREELKPNIIAAMAAKLRSDNDTIADLKEIIKQAEG